MRTVLRVTLFTAVLAILIARPFFALALPTVPKPPAENSDSTAVNFQNGRMTIKIQAVPLLTLLEKIAEAADIQIVSSSQIPADQLVSADLRGWSVEKTLVSLLYGYNYIVIYEPGDGNRGVKLRGGILKSAPRLKGQEAGKGEPVADGVGSAAGEGADMPTGSLRVAGRSYSTTMGSDGLSGNAGAARSGQQGLPPVSNRYASNYQKSSGYDAQPSEEAIQRSVEQSVAKYQKPAAAKVAEKPQQESVRNAAKVAREEYLKNQISMLTKRIESGYSDRQYEYWAKIKDPQFIMHDRTLLQRYNLELGTLYKM
jgi:hypothetical protein